jgi:hypothetical protein
MKKERQMVQKIVILKSKRFQDNSASMQLTYLPVTDLVFSDYNLEDVCKYMYFDNEDDD